MAAGGFLRCAAMREADVRMYGLGAGQNGLLTLRQLREVVGLTPRQVARRTQIGALERRHRSVYALSAWPRSFQQDAHAALLAAGAGAVVSHLAAAFLWSLVEDPPDRVVLCVPLGRHPTLQGVVAHRSHVPRNHRVRRPDGLVLVSAPLVMLQVAWELPRAALEDAFETGELLGSLTRRRLGRVLDEVGGRGREGTGPLRALLDARPPGSRPSESPPERTLLRMLRRAGLPEPVRQAEVRTESGTRRLDLAWPALRRGVEVDSTRWHGSGRRQVRDDERDLDLLEVGWLVHHVQTHDLRARPGAVVERIRRFLLMGTACGIE